MHTTIAITNETELERCERFGSWYDNYKDTFEEEPTVITTHRVINRWGGPEEGGWYYLEGWPVQNICIFSKEQAIAELIRIHAIYEAEEYAEEEYDINLSHKYGEHYPKQRPHYE
jgi:hypothetical protein